MPILYSLKITEEKIGKKKLKNKKNKNKKNPGKIVNQINKTYKNILKKNKSKFEKNAV